MSIFPQTRSPFPTGNIVSESQFYSLIQSVGRSALHTQYPDDIEFYLVALELLDSKNKTLDLLIFPINPQSLTITNNNITNVEKTFSGISVVKNPTFVPIDISLKGTFGRKMRFLLGRNKIEASAFNFGKKFSKYRDNYKKTVLNATAKTGYGVCKILEGIHNDSVGLDEYGNSRKVYFYNLAFNSSFQVEMMSLTFEQSYESNMIWNYTLQLKAIAPLAEVTDYKARRNKILAVGNLSKVVNLADSVIDSQIRKLPFGNTLYSGAKIFKVL
jgi:hypothetical protein